MVTILIVNDGVVYADDSDAHTNVGDPDDDAYHDDADVVDDGERGTTHAPHLSYPPAGGRDGRAVLRHCCAAAAAAGAGRPARARGFVRAYV